MLMLDQKQQVIGHLLDAGVLEFLEPWNAGSKVYDFHPKKLDEKRKLAEISRYFRELAKGYQFELVVSTVNTPFMREIADNLAEFWGLDAGCSVFHQDGSSASSEACRSGVNLFHKNRPVLLVHQAIDDNLARAVAEVRQMKEQPVACLVLFDSQEGPFEAQAFACEHGVPVQALCNYHDLIASLLPPDEPDARAPHSAQAALAAGA